MWWAELMEGWLEKKALKIMCAGGAESRWSLGASNPEGSQGEKVKKGLGYLITKQFPPTAFNKDKLTFIIQLKHLWFFKVNFSGLHCNILHGKWSLETQKAICHDKIFEASPDEAYKSLACVREGSGPLFQQHFISRKQFTSKCL